MHGELWFDQFAWLLFLMPFLGFLAAGFSKRRGPEVQGNKILRHDGPARIAHWTHGIGTLLLLISGIILGSRISPSFVSSGGESAPWFNVHFVFAVLFVFGTFYWLGNTILAPRKLKEHLPKKHAFKSIINHYGSMLKIKGLKMPKEEKYFESERVAFIMAVVAAGGVLITGLCKALAHVFDLPEGLMNVMTWGHDLFALLMLLFFVAHIFFGAIAPFAWKAFPSIITGYMPLDVAEHEHEAWIEEIREQNRKEAMASSGEGESAPAADAKQSARAEGAGSKKQSKQGVEYV